MNFIIQKLKETHFPQNVYKLSNAKFSRFDRTRGDKKQIFRTLVDGNTPLLCSGYSPSQNENYVHDECFIFSEGEWKLIGKVNSGRWYGGSLVLDNSKLWLTGTVYILVQ